MSSDERARSRGVILQPIDEPDVFVGMVREIESLGYSNLWCTDSSLHARNCYAYLTLAALNSVSLRLGTAVTNPLTRHPGVTAMAIATVDEISGGRTILGIGTGDRPLLALGMKPTTLDNLERVVGDVRQLWRGETVASSGAGYVLADARLRVGSRAGIPIYISASGPKTLELAGRVADGVLVLTGLFDEAIKWAVSCIEKGAVAAGRHGAGRPHIAVCAYGAIDDEDPEAALRAGQTIASWFPQTAPVICDLAGFDQSLVRKVRASYSGGEFQEAGEAARLLPEAFVRQVALSGTSADARRQIRAVLDAGADSVQVFPLGSNRMDTIRSFGECFDEVLRDGA